MKIKTITCHDVYNVGASLQAYALSTYLQSLGHEVEIIDYKPDYLSNHFPLVGVNNPVYDKPFVRDIYQLAKLPGRLKNRYGKRKREFDEFKKQYLPVTKERYSSNEDLKKNVPMADIYFAGSDQIWNTFFRNGKDPAFYLEFAPEGAIRASYAASFATEDIAHEWKPQITQWLSKFDYISVREDSGVSIINDLGISGAEQVLDPVFLIDVSQWEKIEKKLDITDPYVLLYDFDRNLLISEYAKQIAKKNGWKIYSIFPNSGCDKCFAQEGPTAFLWLIHHAQFVISNSFHATAFSLIYQKQFVVFNREEGINTRMRDLIYGIGLENRMICGKESTELDYINYASVEKNLKVKIDESKAFIYRVLSGVKK